MTKIKITSSIFILLLFSVSPLFSQWVQKQNAGGLPRTFATGFSINNLAYVIGGYDGNGLLYDDVWKYNATSDTWTQMANFPGGPRSAATAFTIGSKGYLGTGTNGSAYQDDFWEYEPVTDTWIQKATFPGGAREEAVGFCIGNKGYLGTGQVFVVTPNNSFTTTFDDFYEYDPLSDTWSSKASLPGPSRAYATGIAFNGKGFIGTGGNNDQSASYTDFYAYDPLTDTWSSKASMGGSGRADAGIFASATDIYVIGGINFPNFSGTASIRQYNPVTDTWSNAANFGGSTIIAPVVLFINGKAYAGTGYNGGLAVRNDWWEFTPPVTAGINENANSAITFFTNADAAIITLSAPDDHHPITGIEIFDAAGKNVTSLVKGNLVSQQMNINISALPTGLYIMKVLLKDQQNQVFKFMR